LATIFPTIFFYNQLLRIVKKSRDLALLGRYDGGSWVGSSLATLRALESVGVRINISGLRELDSTMGPVVYAANHMSSLETFVLPAILRPRGPVTFVVKQSLMNYPWFGKILHAQLPIAVERVNPRKDLAKVMSEGKRFLEKGSSVVIFPQTTRTDTFVPEKFNSMAAKLAARAGVPLVPLALRTGAWGQQSLIEQLKDFGPIRPECPVDFVFGPPQAPAGKGDVAHEETKKFISDVFNEWESVPKELLE
jgi:1-acyl-sn-glycerol-3-phosphate acyltransferase